MSSCICTIIKNENRYLEEWVDYHLNLGFDKIIIVDNNDKHGEIIDDNIKNNEKIIILDDRGNIEYLHQLKVYYNFFDINNKYLFYDWICYIDIDEFLELDNKFNNINEYLSQDIFTNIDQILLNCKYYTTNNPKYLFEYIDEPVLKRFDLPSKYEGMHKVKSIIRNTINFENIKGKYNVAHYVCSSDCSGNIITNELLSEKLNYNELYIKHIYGKSIEELKSKKISKIYCDTGILYNQEKTKSIIKTFYEINRYSKHIKRLKNELRQLCVENSIINDFI